VAAVAQMHVPTLPIERFRDLLGPAFAEVEAGVVQAQQDFRGRVVWHVNSTARGGGVVELLQSLLPYARGAGVDARWAVIEGNPEFFRLTKRIHNNLHGWEGDGVPLDDDAHELYERTLRASATELGERVRPGDVVFCHDPQTAGLVAPMVDAGALVVWRCHVGLDRPDEIVRRTWEFLLPYVEPAHAYVFSRREFAWRGLDAERVFIVPPSIDVFAPKNQDLAPEVVAGILSAAGIAPRVDGAPAVFTRLDGSPGRVDREAVVEQREGISPETKLISQISRWDRLKDPVGVTRGFAEHCAHADAHLLLAGPSVAAVSDDPEGTEVLGQVRALRAALPANVRDRIHLASLPMVDVEENAAIVNAIQRRSEIVVQKSLAEGFGLTVAEAMWKARPVIASRSGGIQDQIVDGVTGVLIDDPTDLDSFGAACDRLLSDPIRAETMGTAAHEWVVGHFLHSRHLVQYGQILEGLLRQFG
jgi:trehalose synthase